MGVAARGVTPADPVERIMATPPAEVAPEEDLLAVAQELVAGDIGAVLVAAPGAPAGVISERDLVTLVATGSDLTATQAGEVMTGDLVTALPGDSIESVGRLMLDAGVRHVPVVAGADGGALVGLVSMRDVFAVLLGVTGGGEA